MRKAIALLALLATVSCGDDIEKRFAKAKAALPPATPPVAVSSDASAKADGSYLESWNLGADRVVLVKYDINDEKHTLTGKKRTDEERDYFLDDASTSLMTAKQQEDAFKILSAAGNLRWKVKLDGNKVKISDNDQNANAFVLYTTGQTTAVTAPDGHLIGTVKYESGKNIVRDGFDKVVERMPSKMFRPAYGVLAIDGIVPPERYAMMVELIDLMPQNRGGIDPTRVAGTDLDSWDVKDGVMVVKFAAASQDHVLRGTPKGAGVREYKLDNGPLVVAIGRTNAKGFMIQSPSGVNRWTVAVDGNLISIGGGDKDESYEFTTNGDETTVTGPAGKLLGTVKYDGSYNITTDAAGDTIDKMPSKVFRPAYGVLLIDNMQPGERYALLAELLDKTRR